VSGVLEVTLAAAVRAYIGALRALASCLGESTDEDSDTALLRASIGDLSVAGAVLVDLLDRADYPLPAVATEITRWLAVAAVAVELVARRSRQVAGLS
jgi:hypothetical protein